VSATFVPDLTPPAIGDIEVVTTATSATISWTTDEPATSSVAYGTTNGYESGSRVGDGLVTQHMVTLTDLTPDSTYHYQVASANGVERSSATGDATFTTATSTAPAVAVWYGDRQTVGATGRPQTWFNVLGQVRDSDGLRSLSYRLNGGPATSLRPGPDLRRLHDDGDFNIEIDYTDLNLGDNSVEITAVDAAGELARKTVTLQRVASEAPALPWTTDWAGASTISERAQVVDGRWVLAGGSIRAVEPGYDRTVALGDLAWSDYEVTVPVTVHELSPGYGTPQSGAPLVGLGLRWNGHTAMRDEQPGQHWYPAGAFMWWRWQGESGTYRLLGNEGQPTEGFADPALEFGTTYMFKAQVRTVPGGAEYRAKVWAAGAPEPEAWSQTILDADSPRSGGILLIAHHVVADWGDVLVEPIEP
jgi:hypothetical protein